MDINLLTIFCNVYKNKSLSITADELDVSTSAISQSITKLKVHFNDPLFIKSGKGVSPTVFSDQLYLDVAPIMDNLKSVISVEKNFNPLESTKSYKFSGAKDLSILLYSKIENIISKLAPNMSLKSVHEYVNQQQRFDDLRNRKVDFSFSLVKPGDISLDFIEIVRSPYVLVFNSSHPRLSERKEISKEDLESELIASHIESTHLTNINLRSNHLYHRVGYQFSSNIEGLSMVSNSDWIMFSPKIFIDNCNVSNIDSVPSPIVIPEGRAYLVWHKSSSVSKPFNWIKELIIDECKKIS
ncbi:LysR substrate-binding domain-containing protein [Vibrio sp. ER1A]|uniref:LysR substrate-binding domain-containing protein n=1 Tax=Vibrio sp. ER1A TaxID=1517681 RepID=UPI0004DD7294|nr:LysR substrate-binding domain-containing protein [Vibrio sp. ER1A]KFA99248.1 hypothetical protein HW45_04955 [Vibrio sp. ER1A]